MTTDGNQLDYPRDPSSPFNSVFDAKIHINSTILDAHKGAQYIGLDIGNFYHGSPMAYLQYIRIHASFIIQEVMNQYDFTVKADGYVYFEIRKGMYGLKEFGIIALTQLVQKITPFGYEPMKFTPGLCRHTNRKTTFTLCVDNFGVKYFSKNYDLHLVNAVKSQYRCTSD